MQSPMLVPNEFSSSCLASDVNKLHCLVLGLILHHFQIHLPSDDQLSVKTFSGFERLSLWPPSQEDIDIFKITPNSKKDMLLMTDVLSIQLQY